MFDTASRWVGQMKEFLRPLQDFYDNEMDAELRSAIEWTFEAMRSQNSGFLDGDQLNSVPLNLVMQAPCIINRDHFISTRSASTSTPTIRFGTPTTTSNSARRSSKDAGIKYPTEVYGKIWDFADTQLPGWIRSVDTETSDFINADWTKSNATSNAWMKGVQFYVDVFRKHKARILRYDLYTAVLRAVLPCTHEKITIFRGAL
ncbi:MAG: hypothetical protein GKR94_17605 [Gammaproteobacteria bacterium]|nr:hypothetical protein [Gammaproteobacteria bacterium]